MLHQQQQQLIIGQAAPPVVTVASAGNTSYLGRVPPRLVKAFQVFSALQVACGGLLILVCAVGRVVVDGASYSSTAGFWCGAFILAAGFAGFAAVRPGTNCGLCCVNTCMVLCILSALLSVNLFATSLAEKNSVWTIITAVVAAFEFILALVQGSLSCRASCCCATAPPPRPAVQVYGQQQQQPTIVINSPQQIVYPMHQSGYPLHQQSGYPPQQLPGYPPQQHSGYPPLQQPGYPPHQQPGYPPHQQPGYPPHQQPGYPPVQHQQVQRSQPPFNPGYAELPPPYEPQASAPPPPPDAKR